MTAPKRIFTITAGRTGTAWLADFFDTNLAGYHCVHEPLGVFDFGRTMPDIRIMRAFNEYGNCDAVKEFWAGKFAVVREHERYAETNHTLCKCGLVENLADSDIADGTTLIILRRDRVKQCVSYINREDFGNITIPWQWYLHPSYKNLIVNPKPFLQMGPLGMPLWYTYEMDARQEYYRQKFGARLNFIEVDLETATTEQGARQFWSDLGFDGACTLPPPKNENVGPSNPEVTDTVAQVVAKVNFDAAEIVSGYLAAGRSLV